MIIAKSINRFRTSDGSTLGLLAVVHALVDCCCAALVFSLLHWYPLGRAEYWQLVIGYNLLAFALQPLCGILVDRYITTRSAANAGIVLTLGAVVAFYFNPYVMIAAAGLGNAFFHVGGGVASMTLKNGQAGPPGLFVAPGALGLAAGAALGGIGLPPVVPMGVLLLTALAGIALCRFPLRPVIDNVTRSVVENRNIVIALLLASVALRSLIGFSVGGIWQGSRYVLLGFAIAAACGKAMGGVVADRVGWLKTGSIALVVSSVLFIGGVDNAWCAVAGMLLLQSTMPVTLAALYRMFPRQPGLTFGLCCLALVAGALPAFTSWKTMLLDSSFTMPLYLVSVVIFIAGLRMVTTGSGECGLTGSRLRNVEVI